MPGALLRTKFYIPPTRSEGVKRPRLIERLQEGLDRPGRFVLLSGPAGFGKTTLLSEFVTELDRPVAWLSLDEGDNEPVRFWMYLIAAWQTVQERIGEPALTVLRASQPVPGEVIATTLINELVKLEEDLVLILDDFHAIQDESIHNAFLFLLEHLPVKLHLVLSTRADPPWPLARFRARNQLIEIRARDLRFTNEEATIFLNRSMDLDLASEDVAALEARTEGWIAGLQLAALSMQGRNDIGGFVKAFTGSHTYVADYLVEEVLKNQPEEVHSFLLQTSILERMNAELCVVITGRKDSQDLLVALHRANLFIVPMDDEGRWFRYHHLLADLLQARLKQSFPAPAIMELHQRAANWYEGNGYIPEAVNHLLAAKDFQGAALVIEQNANSLITRGELATLLRWIETLPAEVISHHPQLMITRIWTLTLAGAVRRVEPLLQQAVSYAAGNDDTPASREILGFVAAIRAFLAMMAGEDALALELAQRAESLLPEQSVHARWLLPYTQGAAYRGQGQYEEAVKAFQRQARMGEEHDNLVVWGTGITAIAIVRRLQGRFQEVGETCQKAVQKLAERGASQFGSLAKLEVPWIEVLVEQNELEVAQRRLAGVNDRMRSWAMPTDRIHACFAQIEVQEALGDIPGAMETLRIAKDIKAKHSILMNLARSVDLYEIELSLANGELATAERLMDALQPGTSRWVELRDQELLLLSRLRLAQGRIDEAGKILSQIASDSEIGERKATMIETLALQARIFDAQGERDMALGVLTQALALGEPERFFRVILGGGEQMKQLLATKMRQREGFCDPDARPSKGYIAKLLDAFPSESEPESPSRPPANGAGLVEPLTARELEVLQLVAAGDSNRTIAEKLVITVSAVKKHTANIYGKLSVNSRTQAIARARQLGLLSTE